MFYIYEHWRPDRDEPFYVGKGRGGRANVMSRRNPHHKAIQSKLHALGMAVEVRIISSGLSEAQAFSMEVSRISMWISAGMDLANKTSGGEGVSGLKFSIEHRKKLGDALRGKKRPPMSMEQRKKISEAMKGKATRLGVKLSAETKAKISAANKGRESKLKGTILSEEVCNRISKSVSASMRGESNPFWGKRHTEETKMKISKTKKAQV